MMPDLNKAFKEVINKMSEGFAYHEIIYKNGKAVNYKLIEVNSAFEKILNQKKEEVIGKLATEVYNVEKAPYLNIYDELVKKQIKKNFVVYFPPLEKHFKIKAFHNVNNRFITIFEDVTEETKRIESLKKSNEFTRVVLNSIGDGVISTNLKGEITGVNPAAEKGFAEKEGKLLGINIFDLIAYLENSNRTEFVKAFEKVKKDKLVYNSKKDYKFINNNKYGSFTISPQLSDDDNLIGTIITIRDVTDKHIINQRVKESELKYRNIINSSKDAMISMNIVSNTFENVNKEFYKMFGFDNNVDIQSLTPYDISPEFQENNIKSADLIQQKIDLCKKHGSVYFDWIHKKNDGSKFYSNVLLSIVKIKNESFIHINIRDIDEKVQTRKDLISTKNELRLKNKISNLFITEKADKFYIKTLNLILKEFEIEYGLFGYVNDDEELVAPSLTENIWDKCEVKDKSIKFPKRRWSGIWGESLLTGKSFFKNEKVQVPKGHIQLRNALSAPIIINNKAIGLFILGNYKNEFNNDFLQKIEIICEYISPLLSSRLKEMRDRKMLIEAKEKAEESDRLKTAFLANMSHEIRTPMNGILGFVSLIKELELSKSEIMNFIDNIDKSGRRMLNILTDIMEASKIESKTIEINKINFNVNDIIDEVFEFFLVEANSKNIQFSVEKPGDDIVTLNSDKTKINQILTNVVGNALKFTNKGFVKFGYKINDENIEFFVKDTGIGIKKENLDKVFERFIQEDISLSREFEGAGLGLSISKAFVELLGGKIWCESEYKKGTAFYFTIPY